MAALEEPASKKARVAGASKDPEALCVYMGLPCCFSEKAAQAYFERRASLSGSMEGVASFDALFKAVEDGRAQYGIVPIENSYSGSLHNVYDLLLSHPLHIVGEIGMVEEYCLVAPKGVTELASVKRVCGHPQIMDACSVFLNTLTSGGDEGVERVAAMNSASACADLKQSIESGAPEAMATAAVAPREAAALHGLEVLAPGIANDSNAETRYLIIGRHKERLVELDATAWHADTPYYKTSVVLALSNQQGSIFKVVSQFALRNVNIVKVETRPAATGGSLVYSTSPRHWDYLFYIDFESSKNPATNKALMASLSEFSMYCRELGTYRAHINQLEVAAPSWSLESLCSVINH